jgi:hypothetical protein
MNGCRTFGLCCGWCGRWRVCGGTGGGRGSGIRRGVGCGIGGCVRWGVRRRVGRSACGKRDGCATRRPRGCAGSGIGDGGGNNSSIVRRVDAHQSYTIPRSCDAELSVVFRVCRYGWVHTNHIRQVESPVCRAKRIAQQ